MILSSEPLWSVLNVSKQRRFSFQMNRRKKMDDDIKDDINQMRIEAASKFAGLSSTLIGTSIEHRVKYRILELEFQLKEMNNLLEMIGKSPEVDKIIELILKRGL